MRLWPLKARQGKQKDKGGLKMDAIAEQFWRHWEAQGTPQCNESQLIRAAEALWRSAVCSDGTAPSAKVIEIGRNTLTDAEKWKLQAALRREETKVCGKEYNRKVTRATKTTKGPTPSDAFPAGRGRPPR